jgi:CYTH domain-containing protein
MQQDVEIEKKFLIYEGCKEFASPAFYDNFCTIDNLINESCDKGADIEQLYLDLGKKDEILKYFGLKVDFDIYEIRIRKREKYGIEEYFITFKSDGLQLRGEKQKPICGQDYSFLETFSTSKVLKKRLEKEIDGITYEFDVYTDRSLIICEAEVKSESELKRIIQMGKDVTFDKKYKNKNLALPNL